MARGSKKAGALATKKDVAGFSAANFPALQGSPDEFREVMTANLAGQELTPFDLDRVRVPAGGGLMWELPTLDERPEILEEVSGIVVAVKNGRAYWSEAFGSGEGANPPDCSSDDLITGHGNPGGPCSTCQYAQWGSAEGDRRGQACRQFMMVYFLREGEMLPTPVVLPPTSLKPFKSYLVNLSKKGLPYYRVLTGLKLERAESGGIRYSKVAPRRIEQLTPEDAARAKEYVNTVAPILTGMKLQMDASDLAAE